MLGAMNAAFCLSNDILANLLGISASQAFVSSGRPGEVEGLIFTLHHIVGDDNGPVAHNEGSFHVMVSELDISFFV